jgi:hypothetical protein
MDATALGEKCAALKTTARNEWARLGTLQRKIEGKLTTTWTPDNADLEYKDLLRKASSPWLLFARDVIAQGCRVDGYDDPAVWRDAWQANGMDGRQPAINREAIGLGKSFILVMPSDGGGVVMRPLSALTTFAVYEDQRDEYPVQVLARVGKRKPSFWESTWIYVDDEGVYRFNGDPARPADVKFTSHGLDVCPVVLIPNTLAIDGEPQSSIEPAIPVYQRIVDATFTLQMVQRYGAFPQKWMAGGEIAKNADGTPSVRSSVDSLLHASGVSGETARFGTFEAADLNQVVAALEEHIINLTSVLQVPTLYFIGPKPNTSADSIVAGESSYHRNLADRRLSLGEGYELALRTAALILGLDAAAADTSSQVHWDDVATYTLNQVSDSVVKLAAVGAPLEMLFAMIPGWTKTDVLEAAGEVRARQAALPAPIA